MTDPCCSARAADLARIGLGPWVLYLASVPIPETVDRMNSGLGASRVGWSLRDPETDVRWVVCSDGLAWPDLFDPLTFALLRAALRFPPGFA